MCGIFCVICSSTEDAFSRQKKTSETVTEYLTARGPDFFGQKRIASTQLNDIEVVECNRSCIISLTATVLHLRGESLTKQPLEDDSGNILVWNGEIFAGLQVGTQENDTTVLLGYLQSCTAIDHVLQVVSRIKGPWAFIYFNVAGNTLFFGRDYFGRRSLLWHLPASSSDVFSLSSVGTRTSTETSEGQFWKEVPADGIYSIDCGRLNQYFLEGGGSNLDFNAALQKHSWKSCSTYGYPVRPVANHFNTDISAIPSSSVEGGASKVECVSSAENASPPDETSRDVNVSRSDVSISIDGTDHFMPSPTRLENNENVGLSNFAGSLCFRDESYNDDRKQVCDGESVPITSLIPDLIKGNENEMLIKQFKNVLMESVRKRVFNLPRTDVPETGNCSRKEKGKMDEESSRVGILYSGGIDSMVLAVLADSCLPLGEAIDLINVAFEQRVPVKNTDHKRKPRGKNAVTTGEQYSVNFDVPDRITGRNGLVELKNINPSRTWNFLEVDVTLEELQKERANRISHLVSPQSTVLDDSIGCALWFAARGRGHKAGVDIHENPDQHSAPHTTGPFYTTSAKVLLVGMGADEQLGGYARHRSRFDKEGWQGLIDEMQMEVDRIAERNLGRDDRCISDHGREARFPFLDEDVVSFLNALPVWMKCDPRLPRGAGEKILLRRLAKSLGLTGSCALPKRAIQFGSRIAKLESSNEKGSERCRRL